MHPALRTYYYSSTIQSGGTPLQPLVLDDTTITFSGANTEASYITPNAVRHFSPKVLWKAGMCYFPFQKRIDQSPGGQIGLIVYDEDKGLDRPRIFGKRLTPDTHTIPVVAVEGGHIYTFQENVHNTPLDIHKTAYANDYEDTDELAEDASAGGMAAYASLIKLQDGNYGIWHRADADYSAAFIKASNVLEGWGTRYFVTNRELGSTRHYTTLPYNNYVDGWYYLNITRRYDDALFRWSHKWLLKTQDFETFYNYDGSFSKNVVSDAVLTEAELIANFQYHVPPVAGQGYQPVTCISPQGNFYAWVGDGDGNSVFVQWSEGAWLTKDITITGMIDMAVIVASPQGGPAVQLTAFSDDHIEALVRVQPGTYIKIHRYVTYDRGDTWEDLGDLFPSINDDIWAASYPENVLEIPNNRNFAIIGGQLRYDEADIADLYFRKAAFGTVQSETVANPLAFVSPADIDDYAFGYKMTSDKVALTGSNVTSFTDQSPNARNATTFGTMQYDAINEEAIFDGTNDYATIPTADLLLLTEFTLTMVFKTGTTAAATHLFSFSNSGTNDHWASLNLTATSRIVRFLKTTASLSYTVNGQNAGIGDDALHVVSLAVGKNKVYLYVDGVLQFFEYTVLSGTAANVRADYGTFISNMVNINTIAIGGARRGSNLFTPMRLKELHGYTRFLSNIERHGMERKLANDYGITLGNQFQ